MRNSAEKDALMDDFSAIVRAWQAVVDNTRPNRFDQVFDSIQGLEPTIFEPLQQLSAQAQKLLLRYKVMHGSLFDINLDYGHVGFESVAAIALLCDTPLLGEVVEYLYEDLSSEDLREVKREFRDNCFYPVCMANKDFIPPLPVNYIQFGGATAYCFLYPTTSERVGARMCELVKSGQLRADAVSSMVDLLSKSEIETEYLTPEDFRDFMEVHLNEVPREPFSQLRQHIFGTDDVTATESSYRLHRALKSIFMPNCKLKANNGSLEDFAQLILTNKEYSDRFLMQEMVSALRVHIAEFDSGQTLEHDNGVEIANQLAQLFRGLAFTDSDTSLIILMAVKNSYAGAAYDAVTKDSAVGAVEMARELFRHRALLPGKINGRVDLAVSYGLWQSMSPEALDHSLKQDSGKIVMYKMSGDRKFLNGIEDRRLLDDTLGADLGL
ncbi:hypothetical protein [Pseudomonas viridiflava]|uniref:hypothetical protein n=1 Tax=Pseudomonas viridiflava TaxID=33069 RepID=UPI000F017505|nr:hypothetical protein [Pseudomonas viridiflava]